MKIVEVIPIARAINKEKLSYFSSEDFPVGTVVMVPLRSKNVPAIVIGTRDVLEEKANIKRSDFSVKKISKHKAVEIFSPAFVNTCLDIAKYLASSTGAVVHSVVPAAILENLEKISTASVAKRKRELLCEKFVVQANDEERYANYKSIVREEFAKGSSVFFCLPTIQEIKKALEILPKGIEAYTFVLHNSLTKKEILATWKKILEEKHCVLILGTISYLSIPREDIGTIIIDRESARTYKSQHRPFLDARLFAEKIAEYQKIRIIFGDILLRTETIWRHKNNELFELYPLKFRSLTTSEQEIIDMKGGNRPIRSENSEIEDKKPHEVKFAVLSDEVKGLLQNNLDKSENLFIFSSRRGLSPITLCGDCSTIVTCHNCYSPVVLHTALKTNFFLCHRCGERRSALEKCQNCDSWRLTTLGIGTELVEKEIKTLFPDLKIFKIDADSANTHAKACQVAEKFFASPGAILIGTEMSLPYVSEKVQNSAVISMDSFFGLPDFRINERIINIILKIRGFTTKKFILQTRKPSERIWDYSMNGNLADFYRDEIADRKRLDYPPFTTLIKISLTGPKDFVVEEMSKLQAIVDPYTIDVFPAFIPGFVGKFIMHGLIRLPQKKWVDEDLLNKLKSLPPQFSVNIDPESLL